jgi:peptide/nickel transport system substrate-binding protein
MLHLARSLLLTSALLAGTSSAVLAAACENEGGVIQAAYTANPTTMDPILTTTAAGRQVGIHLFESLVTLDQNYKVIPQLASGFTRSDDGLTYLFTLREGVKFHNGDVMDADDVVASLQRFLKYSPSANRFTKVASVEAVDAKTIKFTLTEDFPLPTNLAMPTPVIAIMPKEIIEKYAEKEILAADAIGTGPFSLGEWRPDVGVKLLKFADYATQDGFDGPTGFGGARTVCVDEVNMLPVTEEASRVAGLRTGDFDFAEAISITAIPDLETDPAIKIEILKPRWAIVLELDHKNEWMAKLPFRQAMLAAINPEQVLMAATFGRKDFYRVQPSIFFPEQSDWYTEVGSEFYNKPDMERVKAKLAEAGYNGEPIVYLTNQNYGWMYKASQALTAQWQEAGINVQIELMDWPSQIKRAQTQTDWALNQTGWSPRFDPFSVTDPLKCDALGAFGYCNQEMEALLDVINSGADVATRKEAWTAAQKMIWDDLPVFRIGDYFEAEGSRTTISGYVPFYVTPRFWNVSQNKK